MKAILVASVLAALLAGLTLVPQRAQAAGTSMSDWCGWGTISYQKYDNGNFELEIHLLPGATLPDSLKVLQTVGGNDQYVIVTPDGRVTDMLDHFGRTYVVPQGATLKAAAEAFFMKIDCSSPLSDGRSTFSGVGVGFRF